MTCFDAGVGVVLAMVPGADDGGMTRQARRMWRVRLSMPNDVFALCNSPTLRAGDAVRDPNG